MNRVFPISVLVFVVLVWASLSFGEPTQPAAAPASGSFAAQFKEWKALLGRMRTLQEQYQVAGATQRAGIEAEFDSLREKGRAMAPALVAAAIDAYKANPKDKSVADFLMANVVDHTQSEDYEEALKIAKLLLDKGFDDKAIHTFAGFAMYATGDFENAKKQLKAAEAAAQLKSLKPAGEALQTADMEAERWEAERALRAAEAKADDLPRVKLKTSKGDIVVELFENEAPNTVANFVSLVEKGFYDGLKFHRVIPNFMAQGGDPQGDGSGGPGYSIDCECVREDHRNHFRGSLSMAHAGPNTGGSQFFLNFVPTPNLDGKHTVFGRVIDGTDVLAKLQRTEQTPKAGPPDKIVKAEVLRKRAQTEYTPKKNGGS